VKVPWKDLGMTAVYLELGTKKVFASAVDWPGWCRAGKTEELALEALAEYHPRYAVVAKQARIAFPRRLAFDVVERVPGSAATDFGVPEKIPDCYTTPVSAAEAKRLTKLLRATWTVFDDVAAGAPAELVKGPRGGGRDRDKMIDHVLESERSYARMLGIRGVSETSALRDAIAAVLEAPSGGGPLAGKKWTQRYAVSRITWHVLDHAWEMEDKTPAPAR
jgi:hypothetical protein